MANLAQHHLHPLPDQAHDQIAVAVVRDIIATWQHDNDFTTTARGEYLGQLELLCDRLEALHGHWSNGSRGYTRTDNPYTRTRKALAHTLCELSSTTIGLDPFNAARGEVGLTTSISAGRGGQPVISLLLANEHTQRTGHDPVDFVLSVLHRGDDPRIVRLAASYLHTGLHDRVEAALDEAVATVETVDAN